MLTSAIAIERMETVTGRSSQVVQGFRTVNESETISSPPLQIGRQLTASLTSQEAFGFSVGET